MDPSGPSPVTIPRVAAPASLPVDDEARAEPAAPPPTRAEAAAADPPEEVELLRQSSEQVQELQELRTQAGELQRQLAETASATLQRPLEEASAASVVAAVAPATIATVLVEECQSDDWSGRAHQTWMQQAAAAADLRDESLIPQSSIEKSILAVSRDHHRSSIPAATTHPPPHTPKQFALIIRSHETNPRDRSPSLVTCIIAEGSRCMLPHIRLSYRSPS